MLVTIDLDVVGPALLGLILLIIFLRVFRFFCQPYHIGTGGRPETHYHGEVVDGRQMTGWEREKLGGDSGTITLEHRETKDLGDGKTVEVFRDEHFGFENGKLVTYDPDCDDRVQWTYFGEQ